MKRLTLFIIGIALLVLGTTLILAWWPDVVNLFKGATGVILSIVGLFIMYSVKIK